MISFTSASRSTKQGSSSKRLVHRGPQIADLNAQCPALLDDDFMPVPGFDCLFEPERDQHADLDNTDFR